MQHGYRIMCFGRKKRTRKHGGTSESGIRCESLLGAQMLLSEKNDLCLHQGNKWPAQATPQMCSWRCRVPWDVHCPVLSARCVWQLAPREKMKSGHARNSLVLTLFSELFVILIMCWGSLVWGSELSKTKLSLGQIWYFLCRLLVMVWPYPCAQTPVTRVCSYEISSCFWFLLPCSTQGRSEL